MRSAFGALIATRNGQGEYPHCRLASCVIGQTCGAGGGLGGRLEPISADCGNVQVIDDVCPNGPWELTVVVDASVENDFDLLVDDTEWQPNQAIEIMSPAKVWPIYARVDGQTSSNERFNIVVEGLCECGDGQVDGQEQCDDGNTADGDGCSSFCEVEECGNHRLDQGEECDDGNLEDNDGCSAVCTIEQECGNGDVEPGEECDDGNTSSFDGCDEQCLSECGDGEIQGLCVAGATGALCTRNTDCDTATDLLDGRCQREECDDGNEADGDGCSSCQLECGNGTRETNEACDDGNREPSDGCSTDCRVEFACTPGTHFACQHVCCRIRTCSGSRNGPICGDNSDCEAFGTECLPANGCNVQSTGNATATWADDMFNGTCTRLVRGGDNAAGEPRCPEETYMCWAGIVGTPGGNATDSNIPGYPGTKCCPVGTDCYVAGDRSVQCY